MAIGKRLNDMKKNENDVFGSAIDRSSVAFQMIDRIKTALIEGELMPGDYLPSETELAQSLGIGKSSVREAIKMLQAIGVVEVRRGQGTLIRTEPGEPLVDPIEFSMLLARGVTQDVIEFRRMFEPAFTIQAMHRAQPEDYLAIKKTIDDMEEAIKIGEQTSHHDAAFHKAILKATHNPITIRIGENLYQLIEAALETAVQNLPESGLNNHKAIFSAFIKKDQAKLLEAIEKSSESWETILTYRGD